MDWLTGTTFGKFIWAFCISMIPIVELRGGLPVAITSGLPLWLAYIATVLGNMLPVPFIIILDRSVDCRAAEHEDEAGNPDYFCRSMYCGDHRYRDHIRCDSTRVRGVI